MARYQITTLIDITRSNPARTEVDVLKLGQQANFNSLVQAIGLRSNVTWGKDPLRNSGQLPNGLDGNAAYWMWEFDTEREDIFLKDNNPVGLLLEDLHGVPIVCGLTNSHDPVPAIFKTRSAAINTWLTII
jgi:hypothetical protein